MNNFEKGFDKLVGIKNEMDNVRKYLDELRKKLEENSLNFVKENNIQDKMYKLGSLESMLNRGVSAKQLVDLLERSNEWAVYSKLPPLKAHMTGKSIQNEFLNYNIKVFEELEHKFKSLDSVENIENLNNLMIPGTDSYYLIDKNMELMLKSAHNNSFRDNNFVYMIIFNVIKKDNGWVLVYNYMTYNKIFINLLYSYIALEQILCLFQLNKGYIASDFFFVLDEKLRNEHSYFSVFDNEIRKNTPSLFTSGRLDESLLDNYWYNFIHMAKWGVNGSIKDMNYGQMGELIKLLTFKDEIGVLKTLANDISLEEMYKYYNESTSRKDTIYNYLSRFIFIVSDLNCFISSVKSIVDEDVNQGSQKLRGKSNYISYVLTRIDKSFRDSMYNHNRLFLERLENKGLKGESYIPKSCFSYKNIHINLGNVRWYSTLHTFKFKAGSVQNNVIYSKDNNNISLLRLNKRIVADKYKIGELCYSVKVNQDFNRNKTSILLKSDHLKLISSKDPSLFLHSNLIDILVNNPINYNTQILIEKFLIDQFEKLFDVKGDSFNKNDSINTLGIDINSFTGGFKKYCLDKRPEIRSYINNLRNILNNDKKLNKDVSNIKTKIDLFNYYFKLIINKTKDEKLMSCLFYSIFKVISFNGVNHTDDKMGSFIRPDNISVLNINLYIGKYLTNLYYKKIYEEYLDSIKMIGRNIEEEVSKQKSLSLTEFKTSYLKEEKNSLINDDEFLLHIGTKLLEILLVTDILYIKVISLKGDKSQSVLVCNKEIDTLLERKNPVSILPQNLPMIVKPIPYNADKSFGGYLLNGKEYESPLFSEKLTYAVPSEIKEKNILLPVVNNMMNTSFKVNKVLLKYLVEKNHIHNLLIDPDHIHEYAKKEKRTKYEEREYQSYLSKRILEHNILILADIYSNVPEFYIPIKLDNRGRLYPIVSYFHYQSNELAKALILFSRPDTIKRTDFEEIEYLKAYGASCYGNGLNRKSYTTRVEWVDNNWSEIINYENSNLVKNADDKFLFISFCIEMKRFDDFLNNENEEKFKTYLPIRLDGTCNGFQHLALLANETAIFEHLNLSGSSKNHDPKDLYNHILDSVNVYIENKRQEVKDKDEELYNSYTRLLEIGLSRKEIKSSIMNKPYNAKDKTLAQYVKDSLKLYSTENISIIDKKGEDKSIQIGWYKVENSVNNNCINYRDIELLVITINNIIYVKYPNIFLLTNYFKDMTRILNKLNLPIIWRLPTGLKITQKYMSKRTIKIEPFTFIDNSITLTITDKIKIDKNKQISALMPNLVHSLDATALILLYNSFYNSIDKNLNVNFYSVHDCYGVTAKYVGSLINMLRTVYIDLYSGKGYIEKFDEDIIMSISQLYGEKNCIFSRKDRILYIKNYADIKLPEIAPFLLKENKDLAYERLSKSIYFIN